MADHRTSIRNRAEPAARARRDRRHADVTRGRSARSPEQLNAKTPREWYIALACTGCSRCCSAAMLTYLVATGIGVWGNNQPGRLGLGHHQLRLLDRHRPRRHADLGHSVPVPAEVAHLDQPLRRGDDDLRRDLRRHLPAVPHRPSVARRYWLFPIPNPT